MLIVEISILWVFINLRREPNRGLLNVKSDIVHCAESNLFSWNGCNKKSSDFCSNETQPRKKIFDEPKSIFMLIIETLSSPLCLGLGGSLIRKGNIGLDTVQESRPLLFCRESESNRKNEEKIVSEME